MSDIFISYSSKDKNIALNICAKLEQANLKCWMAPRDINPGEEYAAGIMRGINNCTCMVLVFSDNSNQSRHVLSEVESAFSKSKVIVPFRIADVMPTDSMEYFLKVAHWLDASSTDLDRAIEDLRKTLAGVLQQPITTQQTSTASEPQPTAKKSKAPLLAAVGGVVAIAAGLFLFMNSPSQDHTTAQTKTEVKPQPAIKSPCDTRYAELISGNAHLLNQASEQNLASVNKISCALPNRQIQVTAWTEPRRSQFMAGDLVSFKVSVSADAYLAVYVHSMDGTSYLIYPNPYAPPELIESDQIFTVGDTSGDFVLEVAEPFGVDAVQFIASTDAEEFIALMQGHEVIEGTPLHIAPREVITRHMQGINSRGIKVKATQPVVTASANQNKQAISKDKLWGESVVLLNTRAAE